MEKEIDYLVANENCKEAIKELMFNGKKSKWLLKYKRLFKKVSIHPKGLPSVANANFDGFNYGFIRDFHYEYAQVLLEITNKL
jgi:hypothetical protein